MSEPMHWPLTLERTQTIVNHLIHDGTTQGLLLGDELNKAMGESARRRAEREQQPTHMRCPRRPEGDNSTHHMLPTQGGDMFCRYCRQSRAQILKED